MLSKLPAVSGNKMISHGKYDDHFRWFRENMANPMSDPDLSNGLKPFIYADWLASGRLFYPVERIIASRIAPFYGNTHSESSFTGQFMTDLYHESKQIIKDHVHATGEDILIPAGTGTTGAIAKLQRLLGLKPVNAAEMRKCLSPDQRPVVFITHMEHHSNHVSWLETLADVVILPPDANLLVSPEVLESYLRKYRNRKLKIGSFTACSNVSGIRTPLSKLAALMHRYNGFIFVDYAASAPYDDIDMHPPDKEQRLDAIFFSPHKFLGGPGSAGILIFSRELYSIDSAPDQPGGGTVRWSDPWGGYSYEPEPEIREDGGTPGILQLIRAALAVRVKEEMGTGRIRAKEQELMKKAKVALAGIPGLDLVASEAVDTIGVLTFRMDSLHYNLVVKLLSDRFGIMARGGCFCAGIYGHYLLNMNRSGSEEITQRIDSGDYSEKPGWVRISIHPTTTYGEIDYIADSIREIMRKGHSLSYQYKYFKEINEFRKVNEKPVKNNTLRSSMSF